jgi:RimJ/RimL family protein N-acetyltransferase
MIPLLETERLRFRAWNAADFEPFAAIYADEADARYIGGACERDEACRRLAGVIGHWTLRGYGLWAQAALHGQLEVETLDVIKPDDHGSEAASRRTALRRHVCRRRP